MDELKLKNDANEAERKEQLKKVEQMRKDNILMDEKNRNLQKMKAALDAKFKFIEEKYDYTSAVKKLETTDFTDLITAHTNVNMTMEGFKDKLNDVKTQIQQIEAERESMKK